MAGPYDSLGFEIASVDDVRELALSVLPQAAETRVENGAYARWAPGGGEELWFRLDRDGELVGAHAHFSGSSRLRLSLEQRVRRRGESPLGGGFLADVIDEEGDEWCQLVFDGTDPAAYDTFELPAVATAQVAAFAFELEVHESPETFASHQEGDDLRFASESFAPAGLFEDEPEATAVFTGHVVESAMRTNSLTGREYGWAAVESLGGTYDVVASQELLPAPPPAGAVVMGSFWLSGRLLDEPQHVEYEPEPEEAATPRKGLLRRLFG